MKKLLYTFLAVSIIFAACKKEDEVVTPTVVNGCTDSLAINYNPLATIDDGSCTYTPTSTVYDTLLGFWNLTHYDIGDGLEVADTGQYINFLNDIELEVNVGVPGWTWTGSFIYDATSDSLHTMFQDMSIVTLDNLNMTIHNIGSFSDYDLYFEK